MPVPTIVKGSDEMFTITYEGNGKGQRVGNFVPYTDNGTIAKSCIFNRPDDPMLAYTPSGTGTNRRKYTISLWFKRSFDASDSNERALFFAGPYGNDDGLTLKNAGNLNFWMNGTIAANLITNRTFDDPSKFYHILVAVDTTQSTASDRVKLYVDGDQITSFGTENYPTQNYDGNVSTAVQHNVGAQTGNNRQCDGNLAEVNYVDGTALTPSTFGLTDTSTGRWIPKTLTGITYGTNGFRLEFANSAGQTIGDDTSGQGNDLTVTNLAATDIVTDSPTQNHMNMGGRIGGSITMAEGNLKASVGAADTQVLSSFGLPPSGKWYWEVKLTTLSTYGRVGVTVADDATSSHPLGDGMGYDRPETANGVRIKNVDIGSGWDGAFTQGNVMNFALDADNKFMYIGENNTWRNSGDPTSGATGTGGIPYGSEDFANKILHPAVGSGNAGGTKVFEFDFGQKGFAYTPPTGYSAPQQDNFPTTDKGISDFVWIKNRDATDNHQIYDSSRGERQLFSLTTVVSQTLTTGLQKFLKGGQQLEDYPESNTNGESYVSWNWHANGGTTSANTDGSGGTVASTIQANQTAGFSIVEFTAPSSGTDPFSVAHGLGKVPRWFMFKRKTGGTSRWLLFHKDAYDASNGGYSMELHASTVNTQFNAEYGTTSIYTSDPTTTTFSLRNNSAVTASADYIAYCWAEIEGYSRFGTYVGNASTDGPFLYTGFKPSWVMVKNRQRATGWYVYDNKRTPFNQMDGHLIASSTAVEGTGSEEMDFLSNGFKCRGDNSGNNRSGEAFIYMAFAEHPFLGDGTNPCTAR